MPFLGNTSGGLGQAVRSQRFTLDSVAYSTISVPFNIDHMPIVSVWVQQTAGAAPGFLQVYVDRDGDWVFRDVMTLPVLLGQPAVLNYPCLVASQLAVRFLGAGVVAPTDEVARVWLSATALGARAPTIAVRPAFG